MGGGIAFVLAVGIGFALGVFVTTIAIIAWSERRYREDVYKPRDYRCGEPPHYKQK